MKINLPNEALKLSIAKKDAEQCAQEVDARLEALFAAAKGGRLEDAPPAAPPEETVPF